MKAERRKRSIIRLVMSKGYCSTLHNVGLLVLSGKSKHSDSIADGVTIGWFPR
jgi:hypothetical protein